MTDKKSALQEFSTMLRAQIYPSLTERDDILNVICIFSEALDKDLSEMREMIEERGEPRRFGYSGMNGGGGAGGKMGTVTCVNFSGMGEGGTGGAGSNNKGTIHPFNDDK